MNYPAFYSTTKGLDEANLRKPLFESYLLTTISLFFLERSVQCCRRFARDVSLSGLVSLIYLVFKPLDVWAKRGTVVADSRGAAGGRARAGRIT